MSKAIKNVKLSDTLSLSECRDGHWLYDKTRGMNIAMRAESEVEAFVEALGYYQRRLIKIEQEHNELTHKVESFISQFYSDDAGENY